MHHANASIHGDAIAPAFPSVAHFRASKHALEYPFPKCSHHINGTYPTCPVKTYTSPTCFWKCDSKSTSKVTYDQSRCRWIN